MQLTIREDESAVATEKSSCVNTYFTSNIGASASFGKSNEAGDKSGKFEPYPLSKSATLGETKKCEKWVDKSGMGGYVVNLDVIRPGDSEFNSLYSKLTYGFTD